MRSHRHGFDEILTPEEYADRPSIDLTVKRANSKGDADVAVIVDRADEVFEIPSAVSFKDGETEATLTVGCKNLEALKPYQFTIHLDENATNPYVKVVENARFTYQDNIFPAVTSDIYELEGQNKFKIENFLGSGVDLSFKIIPQDPHRPQDGSIDYDL